MTRLAVATLVLAACAASPPPVADPAARARDEAEVIARSDRQWQAIMRGDRVAAAAFLAPDFMYLSASSKKARDRDKAHEMENNFAEPLRDYRIQNVRAVWLTSDAIVLHYMVDARTRWHDHDVCPHSGATEAWVRRGGEWVIVTRTEYLMGSFEPQPCPVTP